MKTCGTVNNFAYKNKHSINNIIMITKITKDK